jgi:uncharacterized protein (TIGR00369 family)
VTHENPDHLALHVFLAGGAAGPMHTSPLLNAMGASLECWDSGAGRLIMGFAPQPMFRQGAGFVQGGALAVMLDFVMAFTGMAVVGPNHTITTTNMTTNFLAGATGSALRAIGEVERAGRRVIYARAALEAGGKSVASASSTLLVL